MQLHRMDTDFEEDPYILEPSTPLERFLHFSKLVANPHTLNKYFLTLFDRHHEKELLPSTKRARNQAESVIFCSSVGGRVLGLGYLAQKLSFLRGRRFSPLKDLGVFCLTAGAIYLLDSVPLAMYWPYFEDALIKRDDDGDLEEDPYAAANLPKYKVWYYQKFY